MAKKAAKRRVAKTIKINCKGSGLCELKRLKVIQGELKSLSPGNEAKLRKRIEQYGFDAPFFVWKNKILDGTQRKLVLEKMIADGWTLPAGKVPVCEIKAKNLSDAKNRLLGYVSQYGKLDGAGLDVFLKGIEVPDLGTIDLPDFDFGKFDAEFIHPPNEGLTDPDAVPDPPKKPKTRKGDLYLLGEHRLLCGDATKVEDVERVMGGQKADIMATDPPYGVKLDQSWRDVALGQKAMGPGNKNKVAHDDICDWTDAWSNFTGSIAYVWHASKYADIVMQSLRNAGLEVCQQLIWNKSIMVMGRSDYHFKHEPCLYAVRKGNSHNWVGDRKQTTVIDAASPNHIMSGSKEDKTSHPTQKPVACFMFIVNHSGNVYDPFLGSGTTLIAAEKLNRKCYGLEIDPIYCDVIVKRWEEFTGKKAKRVRGKNG